MIRVNNSAKKEKKPQYLVALAVVVGVVAIWLIMKLMLSSANEGLNTRRESVTDADIVIPISEVTENATFYPAVVGGTEMEVIAVKAPDGTIRTAFNTCQVCYLSGRGYYTQSGDVLVCQNCGNRFTMSDIEVVHSGCNPIPITEQFKSTADDKITIPLETLNEAKPLFASWKR